MPTTKLLKKKSRGWQKVLAVYETFNRTPDRVVMAPGCFGGSLLLGRSLSGQTFLMHSLPTKDVQLIDLLLKTPSPSLDEDRLVAFIHGWANALGINCEVDASSNVKLSKPSAGFLPTAIAHLDTVWHRTNPVLVDNSYFASRMPNYGIGADDKAGVFICMKLVQQGLANAVLFTGEECGMQGSKRVSASWFDGSPYVLSFDCDGTHNYSESCDGIPLYDPNGKFWNEAKPTMEKFGFTKGHRHPFTDVCQVRKRFGHSCLNLGSGYYDYHRPSECLMLYDVQRAFELAVELIGTLKGSFNDYYFKDVSRSPNDPTVVHRGRFWKEATRTTRLLRELNGS